MLNNSGEGTVIVPGRSSTALVPTLTCGAKYLFARNSGHNAVNRIDRQTNHVSVVDGSKSLDNFGSVLLQLKTDSSRIQ